jgi:hypothetical protein
MAHQDNNRRREPRALTAALIQIVDEYYDTSTCVLEDVSTSGARVHSDIALRVGVHLTVKAGSVAHRACVKHCKPALGGFDVGLEFVGGRWPVAIELPIHWIHADRY